MESNNLQALDMLGHIYSELGDTQKAKGISFMQAADYYTFCCYLHASNSSHLISILLFWHV